MTRSQRRRFRARFRPHRAQIATGVTLSIFEAALLIPIPILIGVAIDDALPDGDTAMMVSIGVAMAALAIVSVFAQIGSRRVTLTASLEVVRRLRHDLYERMIKLPRSTYDNTPVAHLHDAIVQDSLRVQTMSAVLITTMLPSALLVVGIAIVLISLNWVLALVTLAFAPVLFVVGKLFNSRIRDATDDFHPAYRDFSARALLMLRSQELVRLAGAEDHELETADRQLDRLHRTNMRVAYLSAVNPAIQQGVIALAGAALLTVGGITVIRTSMSLGELLSFYAGFAILRGPAGSMAQSFALIVQGQQALARISELLDGPEERPYTGTDDHRLCGHLQLDGVTFGYDEKSPVLHGVSVDLEPGKIVALVGPNGSGKSSIVNLLLGFYRPDEGKVLADGVPYDSLDMTKLRPQLGVVTQEPFLLPDTVHANVVYGHDPDESALNRALELSGAADVVSQLPDGIHTEIGEDGVRLSGGQRQRIAIARALMGQPKVLIFDEPTNHLDASAVGTLIQNLRGFGDEVAVLIVSHRSEVLLGADTTIALEDGRIAWERP